jgi:hypothetical protein
VVVLARRRGDAARVAGQHRRPLRRAPRRAPALRVAAAACAPSGSPPTAATSCP